MADAMNQHKRLASGQSITPSSGSGGPRSNYAKGGAVRPSAGGKKPPKFTKKGSKANC